MSRQKDQRKHRFYGIFADPWRKLISVSLAVLLWYWLNGQITMSYEEKVPLHFNDDAYGSCVWLELNTSEYGLSRFVNADTGEVLTQVGIKLEGPNSLIKGLKKPGQMAFKVLLSRSDVDQGDQKRPPSITFDKDAVHHRHNPVLTQFMTKLVPRLVRVELRRQISIPLPLSEKNVELQITGNDPSVAQRLTNPTFVPDTVKIFGAEEHLQGIGADTKLFVATVDPRKIDNRPNMILSLELAPEFKTRGLTLTPPNVIYKIEPRRVTYRLMRIPVVLETMEVDETEGRKFEVKPKFVDFMIHVNARSKLDSALNDHRQASIPVSVVPSFWSLQHAVFRVRLHPDNISATEPISRQPTLDIYTRDQYDRATTYELDFSAAEDLPIINIVRKKQ